MEVTVSVTLEEKGVVEHGHGVGGVMLATVVTGSGCWKANPESMSLSDKMRRPSDRTGMGLEEVTAPAAP